MAAQIHPLLKFLRIRAATDDQTIEQAAEAFAVLINTSLCHLRGVATIRGRAVLSWAAGKRRPKPPASGAVARLAGIDELLLLRWGRDAVPVSVDSAPVAVEEPEKGAAA